MSEDTLLRLDGAENMEILSKLQSYLAMICPAMLFDGQSTSTELQNAMSTLECNEAMARFVSTSDCSVLLVERDNVGSGIDSITYGHYFYKHW